ncbi:MAG: lipoyl(octanoyl) transferase LipB [Ignavibacteriales bacterium]|nr:lipoyl(octanoyl) transferase LipB [Ignavibacteriales bacterium]
MNELQIINLGLTVYQPTWELQQKIFNLRVGQKIPDVLLLTEHKHVYTLGKSSDEAHLLADEKELRSRGVDIYHIDRGGDITYHGPGQLVGYPIIDLNNFYLDTHRYLHDLEEVIIRTLKDFDIHGHREENYTGVWVGTDKIAAIGVKVSRWVTMHGFALNVNTNLSYFDRIIPCGIFHKGVTSMQKIIGNGVSFDDVIKSVSSRFSEVFGTHTVTLKKDDFLANINQITSETIECLQ